MSQNTDSIKCLTCNHKIVNSNSARNFKNPVYSVKYCIDQNIIAPNQKILEIGSGNLRNSNYLLNLFSNDKIFCYDIDNTYSRFFKEYSHFKKNGGQFYDFANSEIKFDVVICTYVLETFCPSNARLSLLKRIYRILKGNGILIGSFRGYKGIIGTKYISCPSGDGYISPLKTFVKPHSIPEISNFLNEGGFQKIKLLEGYKVEKPQNIHLMAWKNGQRMD